MQFTSSPRRALGLLAAGTVGLSTALLGIAGGAQAATVPLAPEIPVRGRRDTLDVYFDANHPDDDDIVTPWARPGEYTLDGDGVFDPAVVATTYARASRSTA